MAKIRIIQIGRENWSQTYHLSEDIAWCHLLPEELEDFVRQEQDSRKAFKEALEAALSAPDKSSERPKLKKPTTYQGLLLTDNHYDQDLTCLDDLIDVYAVFYGHPDLKKQEGSQTFLERKLAQLVDLSEPQAFLDTWTKVFFKGQYGAKMGISDLEIAPSFVGSLKFEANRYAILDGDYGSAYQQIAYFRYNIPFYKASAQDIFFDHKASAGVETKILVQLIQEGSLMEVVQEWVFDGQELRKEHTLNAEANGYLMISLLAKGRGVLTIGPCHYRFSRLGFGTFVLGGERYVDDNQDEFMAYFHPMDFKPPLCVYFSGWRAAEGFEGYGMMRALGAPFLLICDPRLSGGAFYLGNDDFEQQVAQVIQDKLDVLAFDRSQLILSGMSMGTFGATYHGGQLSPHALVLSKPVFSLGEVALKEKRTRPGGFNTSLDLLRLYGSQYDAQGAEDLNKRFWDRFKAADFSQTKFFVGYMKDEDYDASAFKKLLEETKHQEAKALVLQGMPGRHNDMSDQQIRWFVAMYQRLLKQDFGRGG